MEGCRFQSLDRLGGKVRVVESKCKYIKQNMVDKQNWEKMKMSESSDWNQYIQIDASPARCAFDCHWTATERFSSRDRQTAASVSAALHCAGRRSANILMLIGLTVH